MANKILRLIKIFYTPLTLIFILYFSWTNRELLFKLIDVADISCIILSILFWCILHLLSPLPPKIVFSCMGYKVPYSRFLQIHISRLPARYLPGGIWHTVGRLRDYHAHGISKNQVAIFTLIETLFPCIITFLLGGGYLWLTSEHEIIYNMVGTLAAASLCILVFLPLWVNKKFSNYLTENFYIIYFLLVFLSILFWITASASFVFYYSSMAATLLPAHLIKIAATYIFSWGVGYISIFAPQGIGVFELVAGKIMDLPMTLGGAISFLAGFRIVAFAADVLSWLAYYGVKRTKRSANELDESSMV